MHASKRNIRSSGAGFSLVEMLFVVGIIVLLAALSFPLAGSVRAKAQRANCLNNIRQWNLALNLYLDEHRGVYPGWKEGEKGSWFEVLPPYVDQPAMSETVVFPGQGRKSMFLCPSDGGDGTDSGTYYSSYTFNSHVSKTDGAKRQHQIKNPDKFVVFAETGIGERGGVDLSSIGDSKNGSTAFRHSTSVCLGFADGSAGSFRRNTVWRDGLAATDNFGGLQWNPENDDLEGPEAE